MKLTEIREIVRALPSGGSDSPDSRFSDAFLDRIVDSGRELLIRNEFTKYKRIDPTWVQSYTPVYSADLQESKKYVTYYVPSVIELDGVQDGRVFIGGDCDVRFRQCNSRGEFSALCDDRLMNPKGGLFSTVLFEGEYMKVYSLAGVTTPPSISAVFRRPSELPTFNIQYDEYPCGDIKMLTRIIIDNDLIIITKSAIDRVKDGFDSSAIPNQPAR